MQLAVMGTLVRMIWFQFFQLAKENIQKWLQQIHDVAPDVPVAVLGNKADKFSDLQQSESVKIRDGSLYGWYKSKTIKNFLISIKEDTHLEFSSSFWSGSSIEEKQGCLIGLEYLLENLLNKQVNIHY